jgi:predicted O-methyltransferase YrrM
MMPWMNEIDTHLIEKQILGLNKNYISVLEWGAGGSTSYFTSFMRDNNISYQWISLEYNEEWYDRIVGLNIPNVELKLFGIKTMSGVRILPEYISYPLTLNKKFDFILVDGRSRRKCLVNASKIINEDGVVLLHDADRTYYHCAFNNYNTYNFLSPTLWMGKIINNENNSK